MASAVPPTPFPSRPLDPRERKLRVLADDLLYPVTEYERILVVDPVSLEVLFDELGDSRGARLTPAAFDALRGRIGMHNHPLGGGSFTTIPGDIEVAIESGLVEMRATSIEDGRRVLYWLAPAAGGWGDDPVGRVLEAQADFLRSPWYVQNEARMKEKLQLRREAAHRETRAIALTLGFRYVRIFLK
jgi:hypothetical protein